MVEWGRLTRVNFEVPSVWKYDSNWGCKSIPNSTIAHFKTLPDPRVNRTKEHELVDVLTIGVCTLLCAA